MTSPSAYQRLKVKLRVINYPAADTFNPSDRIQLRNFIVWLEDRIIRALPVDKRFRDIDSADWPSFSQNYLASLKCPFGEEAGVALCDWLAVVPEPLDVQKSGSESVGNGSDDIFSHINIHSTEFKQIITKLARALQIPNHPDPVVLFKAVCLLIEQKLSSQSIERATAEYGTIKIDQLKVPEVCLGFEVSDPELRAAAVALRLLNVNEMRRLQDLANAAIVQVQRLTADPKTDEKLGKVGF
ncbi:RNA transcription, translation and transport factor protein [Clonorchis sinensis]|uniref:RNA transcription, translation and transport factor protein n=1 Tax=Clonorchis sinensis TaxID=79923 RepID=A0A8T1MR22_CLOSI|nr:RNA transcription, translation and transport factor protein [Clonorchis sinensis]